ncbi:hypothetical protein [Herbidospora yilanensis]|uniref:hypothetical protein n=1 Tax=Herbidospora yilanensis TaxID=354426 RepID=UPI0007824BFD|nr:hypothetical protein [Herbidospora yilanensis]
MNERILGAGIPFVLNLQAKEPVKFRLPKRMHPSGQAGEISYQEMCEIQEHGKSGTMKWEEILFSGTKADMLGL